MGKDIKEMGVYFLELTRFLLIVIWLYTAISKIIDFQRFTHDMRNQEIYPLLATILIYFLPVAETLTAILLMFDKTSKKGLVYSFCLLTLFTSYISLVILNVFKKQPCPCGGILQNVSWESHIVFNLFLLTITTVSIIILKKGETAINK